MATHRTQLALITSAFALIAAVFFSPDKCLNGQALQNPAQPFIGFRPFGDLATVSSNTSTANITNRNNSFQPNGRTNAQANTPSGQSVTANTRIAYPYPAGPNVGSVGSAAGLAPERATLNSQLSGSRVPTGSLNRSLGQATMPLVGTDPALAQRYQQELQQRQSQQLRYQQYQLWLQQQRLQQQRVARQNVASSPQPTLANRPAQSPTSTRSQPSNINFRTKPKLNQVVVQQVSSTATNNRDTRVARANFDSQQTSLSDLTTTARSNSALNSAMNTVAKPQCCVPNNCCPPNNAAQAFRPQAANQIPSLNTGAGQAGGYGFLGQNGAGYQAQAQSGYQFQPGLGVPQFASTGAYGNGGWFSNIIRGTGAYRPLIPLEPQYPNARPGRGIIGQPTAYVDGQPIRNLLRYVMP